MNINQEQLVQAWERTLPEVLESRDSVKVTADQGDSNSLRIHINTAGRTKYEFDFKCTYLDPHEVKVDMLHLAKGGRNDEDSMEIMKNLADDYVRHIHECAQALQNITH